jgi:hypothetical protein
MKILPAVPEFRFMLTEGQTDGLNEFNRRPDEHKE